MKFFLTAICVLSITLIKSQCINRIVIHASDNLFTNIRVTDNTSFTNSTNPSKDIFDCFAWTDNTHNSPSYNERDIFRFDLSNIPSYTVIDSAKLFLYPLSNMANFGGSGNPTYGNANAALIQRNTVAWNSANLSWSNLPTTDSLYKVDIPQSISNRQSYQLNCSSLIQYWINNPSLNFGATFKMQNEIPYNSLFFNCGIGNKATQLRLEIYLHNSLPSNYSNFNISASSNAFTCYNVSTSNPTSCVSNKNNFCNYAWTDNLHGLPVYNGRTIFKFDLSNLPSNIIINKATLYLYPDSNVAFGYPQSPTYGNSNSSLIFKNINNWDTSSLSWYNLPGIDSNDYVEVPQSKTFADKYEIDLTSLAQEWIDSPSLNFGATFTQQIEQPYNCMFFHGSNTFESQKLRLSICYNSPLALDFISYKIHLNANKQIVNSWVTSNETDVKYFIIQRSIDGKNFNNIGTKPTGNSSYSFTDSYITPSSFFYYRIVAVNKDGSYNYSETKSIQSTNMNFKNISIYPNPAINSVSIESKNLINQIKIADCFGHVLRKFDNVNKFISTFELSLLRGIYLIEIINNTNEVITEKFVVQ